MLTSKAILVTGANKGIGKALCQKLLQNHDDVYVFLGSRDKQRGEAAVQSIVEALGPDTQHRIEAVQVDVTDDASVEKAAADVAKSCAAKDMSLYAIVNNAGAVSEDVSQMLDVNLFGVKRVCSAFIPLIKKPAGRVVIISSGAAPMHVAKLAPEEQKFFVSEDVPYDRLEAAAKAYTSVGSFDDYCFSKACVNVLLRELAKDNPDLIVNACTPGFIDTDLSKGMGATKTPEEGTVAPLIMLFKDGLGTGKFFGSDGLRSPLDKVRDPGTPEYNPDAMA